ncbi:MAG: hypothetical protein RBR07_07665 [Arcobacteraceae bacterium]|nr:hypothetical protein [Arcobacteraceae bacterium]
MDEKFRDLILDKDGKVNYKIENIQEYLQLMEQQIKFVLKNDLNRKIS